MDNLKQFLADLGLSDKESELYLVSLRIGPQPASLIAKRTGFSRSTVNFLFDELLQKGFASKKKKQNVTYYSVISPDEMEHVVLTKFARAKKLTQDFKGFFPVLEDLRGKWGISNAEIKLYEGLQGVCHIVDSSFAKDETVYFISGHDSMHPVVRQHVMDSYVPTSRMHKNKNKMIIEDGPKARKYVKAAEGVYDEILFVNPEHLGMRFSLAIFGDKVAFFSYDPADL